MTVRFLQKILRLWDSIFIFRNLSILHLYLFNWHSLLIKRQCIILAVKTINLLNVWFIRCCLLHLVVKCKQVQSNHENCIDRIVQVQPFCIINNFVLFITMPFNPCYSQHKYAITSNTQHLKSNDKCEVKSQWLQNRFKNFLFSYQYLKWNKHHNVHSNYYKLHRYFYCFKHKLSYTIWNKVCIILTLLN